MEEFNKKFDEAFPDEAYRPTGLASILNDAVSSVENYVEKCKISPDVAEKLTEDIKEAATSARTVLDEIKQLCKIQIIAIKKQNELFLDVIRREVENVTLQACNSIEELEKALEVKIKKSAKELIVKEEQLRLQAEEEARLKAEEEARLKAEEEARLKAEEEASKIES